MVLSFLLMTTILVQAQRGGEQRIHKKVNHLAEALELTTEQQIAVKDVLFEQQENRKAPSKKMRDMSEEERATWKAERKAEKAAVEAKITNILTPEQQVIYEDLKKERKEKWAKRGKGKKGKRSKATLEERTQKKTDRLSEKLDLDATQQTAVYDLLLNNAPDKKGKNFRELSEEERAARKAEFKEKKAFIEAELAKILTPAQLELYQSMEKGKRGGR